MNAAAPLVATVIHTSQQAPAARLTPALCGVDLIAEVLARLVFTFARSLFCSVLRPCSLLRL
jgi:hypothetical protein